MSLTVMAEGESDSQLEHSLIFFVTFKYIELCEMLTLPACGSCNVHEMNAI